MGSRRLDRALVEEQLVASRSRAAHLVVEGLVRVDGRTVRKAAAKVTEQARLEVDDDPWVSRAAHKLLGALTACPSVDPRGRRCLDAGASTGGFTQVLLSREASAVVAVDVGHDQLAPALREEPRVTAVEGLNLRHLRPGELGEPFDLIVADLSFISLRLIVPALAAQAALGAELLLMVKPQFEVGRERLARTGVVSSPQLRREAVAGVVAACEDAGLRLVSAHRSPLPGQDGNLEFFLHLRAPARSAGGAAVDIADAESAAADRLEQIDHIDYRD
ncbi:TlyA family RNA methyltransferase [Nesterenkonia sp. F]|uniref:TlyA family RNA methyltransferase n=1 Tax=Nesterenkonia sp. F TaxID=795955 RepID=UPI000255C85E|nr:TlyA family RNA methyltransferase [Nesterenkonia sp. F]